MQYGECSYFPPLHTKLYVCSDEERMRETHADTQRVQNSRQLPLHPAARICLPDNDPRVRVWIYESELLRQMRPIDALCVVAMLGHQLKQVGAHVYKQDVSSVTTPSAPQGQAFVAFAASQARARHAALNPECELQENKRPKWWSQPHQQWSTAGKSWDEMNRNLHLSPHSWVRKIHHMRKVTPEVSVFQERTWISILLSPSSALCYIGQTGAKCNARTLHKRGTEHIRGALDYKTMDALLHASNNHLVPRNVYKHMYRHGPHNFVMTRLQFVSPREAYPAEMYCMRKFGVASLLNTIKPKDAQQKPWQWILRRSAWKPPTKEPTAKCVKQQVHQLLLSTRHNLPLSEYLHLPTVARTVLPPTDFRDFVRKAGPKLLQRFELQLPYSLPMKIPLLTREGKTAIQEVCNTIVQVLTVLDQLHVYLQSAVSVVSQRTSTVGQLLCNQQYHCRTGDVIAMARAECHCSQRDPSVSRSRGHVYILDFTVTYLGSADVIPEISVWHQSMKKASVPDWRTTSSSIFAGLYNAVKPLTLFDIPRSMLSEFAGKLAETCVDQLIDRSRDADHRVQENSLTRAACALKKYGFRAGVYDKADHCVWIACNAFAASLWVECFLSDSRKNKVFRASTQLASQFVLYTHLMHSAAHAFTTHSKQQALQWRANPL